MLLYVILDNQMETWLQSLDGGGTRGGNVLFKGNERVMALSAFQAEAYTLLTIRLVRGHK